MIFLIAVLLERSCWLSATVIQECSGSMSGGDEVELVIGPPPRSTYWLTGSAGLEV